jgi:glycosyltransferase involved in cell wall biosynthesis
LAIEAGTWELSVVIPTRDRASLLDVTIASVLRSPLIVSPGQIIVVDDDSHDDTEAVARKHAVSYLRVDHHNISRTRNAGFSLVRTPYVAFLDHDDIWLPGNMEPQLEALKRHPDAAFAYGIARCASEELQPIPLAFPSPPLPSGIIPDQLHLGYPNLGVVLFRREAVSGVGGFDPAIRYHQDADLLLRIAARQKIVGVDFEGMLHRLRSPSRARADYYWASREVLHWLPRRLGVGWPAAIRFLVKTKGLFFYRFCADAAACASLGHRRDALQCLSRAVRVSPLHALRHCSDVASILLDIRSRSPRAHLI